MTKSRSILGVFSHPDDESMGPGGTLAKYAAAGHRVAFVTATDGGAGRLYEARPADNAELRGLRREETAKAAAILGVDFLGFLGWSDGNLKNMNVLDIEIEIAKLIRREKPDVLVTFHGSGISFHPDHRVVALALNGAFAGSAREGYYREGDVDSLPAHNPAKLYQYTLIKSVLDKIDWPRDIYASPDDEVSTWIDTRAWADKRWEAIQAHDTQRDGPPFEVAYRNGMFETEGFVRVFPAWRVGDDRETDLLAGL
jgi:LmbE family N-acetylglucosaminyl deacetylase